MIIERTSARANFFFCKTLFRFSFFRLLPQNPNVTSYKISLQNIFDKNPNFFRWNFQFINYRIEGEKNGETPTSPWNFFPFDNELIELQRLKRNYMVRNSFVRIDARWKKCDCTFRGQLGSYALAHPPSRGFPLSTLFRGGFKLIISVNFLTYDTSTFSSSFFFSSLPLRNVTISSPSRCSKLNSWAWRWSERGLIKYRLKNRPLQNY